jgi:hypothetical protein
MTCTECNVDMWIVDGGRMRIYDGCVALMCPKCKKAIPRDDSDWAKEKFEQYQKKMGEHK